MANAQIRSASEGANVISNKIRVSVLPPHSRKFQIVRSLVSASSEPGSLKTLARDHHEKLFLQNHANFKRSHEPARIMSFRNNSWVDFKQEVVEVLKQGFKEGKSVVEAQVGDNTCRFDLHRMLQTDLESSNQRSIAWIDVKGQCFFPKTFVNTVEGQDSEGFEGVQDANVEENAGFEFPKIEIKIEVIEKGEGSKSFDSSEPEEASSCKRKWGNEESEKLGLSNLAVKRPLIMDSGEVDKPRWPKVKVLREEEDEYKLVQRLFWTGLAKIDPGARITAIHKWTKTGPLEKARYAVFRMQLERMKRARGDANVVYAWYGAPAECVETSLAHGFVEPTKFAGPLPCGLGVYLSPVKLPQISAMLSEVDDSGEKHVVLCRVILGKCEKVEAGSQQAYCSREDYDTGVDDLMNPKYFVVWCSDMNTHIIPEYVVSFKPANHAAGHINGTSWNWMPPVQKSLASEFFSKLGNSLPPPKSSELKMLCSLYKEGKLGKDIFMKRLRSVVGDGMLRAIIREIHG